MNAPLQNPVPQPAAWADTTIHDTIIGGADARPCVRVAVFGLAQKFQRLLEIVIRHARHNPYRYELARSRGPGEFDVALVDMTAKGGAEVARTLGRIARARPVVTVGRRADPRRPKDDLLQSQFTADLLRALNGAIESQAPELAARASRRPSLASVGGMPALIETATRVDQAATDASAGRDAGAASALPALPATAAAPRSVAGATSAADGPSAAGSVPRVLIVDDSPTVRSQLSVALRQMGLDSDAVDRAEVALDCIHRRRYDLIFVDVNMDGMDGFRLTRRLKRGADGRRCPVIILTSRSSPFDLARGALAGCNSYLVKPVSLRSLRDTVARHLRHLSPAAPARVGVTLKPA